MGIFFVYVLKSAFCVAVFYLFYRLLLCRDTFHRFNRFLVLFMLGFSWLIPSVPGWIESVGSLFVTPEEPMEIPLFPVLLTEIKTMAEDPLQIPFWIPVVILVYLAGVFFFIGYHLYSLYRMTRLLRSGNRLPAEDGLVLIMHRSESVAPFSWMRYIVVSEQNYRENGPEIMAHERAHIRNGHSFDLLLANFCLALQWFNPAAWLLKQELVDLHEYEADSAVLEGGADAKRYQLLLIKKAVGAKLYTMANSFNHSNLKKRISMMLKKKSKSRARLKSLFVLPLAAVAVTALARPEISRELQMFSSARMGDLLPQEVVDTATSGDSKSALYSVRIEKSGNNERKTEYRVSAPDAPKDDSTGLRPVVVTKSKSGGNEKAAEYISISVSDSKRLKSNDQKEDSSEMFFTSDGRSKVTQVKKVDNVSTSTSFFVRGVNFNDENQTKALILVDGKEVSPSEFKEVVSVPDQIDSFSILKDSTATQVYGEKGKGGVVLITTKKGVMSGDGNGSANKIKTDSTTRIDINGDEKVFVTIKRTTDGNKATESVNKVGISKDALVIIDGKESTQAELEKLDPEKVKSFSILKGDSGESIYGEKGKNGVVLIELKEAQKK